MLAAEQLTRDLVLRAEKEARFLARYHYAHLDLDEVISAAYYGLFLAAQRYEDQGRSFWSYARYRVRGEINALARRRTLITVSLEEDHLLVDDELSERATLLGTILANLSGPGGHVIVLYYLHGWNQDEIAAQLRMSATRVSQLRRRSIEKLRKRLGIEVRED